MPAHRRPAALLAVLTLAGCGVGPRYHPPRLDVPATFTSALPTAPTAAPPPTDWWRGFGVPELDRLIDLAATQSLDVRAAAARIVQADQAARVAGSPLLPGITGTLGQTYERTGSQSSGGVSASSLSALTGSTGAGSTGSSSTLTSLLGSGHRYTDTRIYSAELNASYQVDFWGQNLDALRAALATAQFSRFDAQTVWLTTSSSIATTYFQAAGYRDRLAIAEGNLKSSLDVLAAYQARLTVGTASLLDVSQQEALVAGYRAQIPALRSSYEQERIALGVLVGIPPERIVIDPKPLVVTALPEIAPGLPADLLRRRPDVESAEAQLVSQNQTVRQDLAAFFPSLQLTGSGGLSSLFLSSITGPGTVVASLASQLTQTIFDNGAKSGTLGGAKGRYQELVADYVRAVLQAFTDTETALTQASFDAEQQRLEEEAVRTAQRSLDIARAQLTVGTIDIITVLNTQTTLFGDQDTLAQVRIARFEAIVSLYKALGGGWSGPVLAAPPHTVYPPS